MDVLFFPRLRLGLQKLAQLCSCTFMIPPGHATYRLLESSERQLHFDALLYQAYLYQTRWIHVQIHAPSQSPTFEVAIIHLGRILIYFDRRYGLVVRSARSPLTEQAGVRITLALDLFLSNISWSIGCHPL